MATSTTERARHFAIATLPMLAFAGLLALGCNEKRVDHGPPSAGSASPASAGSGYSSSASSSSSSSAAATRQAEERAAAAAQRLQDAQKNATTDQEKIDAVNRYDAERRAMTEGQNAPPSDSNAPPPPR